MPLVTPFGWQVKWMSKKKIVLFIVEGINDETCLGLILSKILNTNAVRFQLTQGDITTNFSINPSNITAKIGNLVNSFRGKIFTHTDFLEVVHLVDTDGAFIPDEMILHDEKHNGVYYTSDNIFTSNVHGIVERNKRKVANLERMLTLTKTCKTIPYSVYFFSSNMDHVFNGNANLKQTDKNHLADQFRKQFASNVEGFINFLAEKSCPETTLDTSWDFIKLDCHSLNCYTNFALYFK